MGTSSNVRATVVVVAVFLVALAPAEPARAQRLSGASSAVRGGGGGSSSAGSAPSRSSSGTLGGASSAVRGSSGARSSGSTSGGSGSGSVSASSSSPPGFTPRDSLDRAGRAVRSGPPVRGPRRDDHSSFILVPRASVTIVHAPEADSAPASAAQDPERLEREEPPRDHWYGGSLGVRLVSPIGPPPRAAQDQPTRFAGAPGTPTSSHEEPGDLRLEEPAHRVIGIVSTDAGYVFDGVGRGNVAARVQLPASVDVFASYTAYFEPNAAGFDALVLGRVGVGLRAIDEDEAQLRIGVALRHFHDWLGSVFGIDGVLGLDVMIEDPLVLSVEGSIGTAGSAIVAQLRGTLGLRFGRVDVYAGYEHVTLQPFDTDLGSVDLSGPIAGVSVVVD